MSRQIFIFFGPPGSGKGSLSQKCIQQLGWKQLSTGALCRKHIAEKTSIGLKIQNAISGGGLIDDSLIIQMVQNWLSVNNDQQKIILDGFPRTLKQAQSLQAFLLQQPEEYILTIVKLAIDDHQVISRLMNRLTCSNNECQLVYSAIADSGLAPFKEGICNVCCSALEKRADDEAASLKNRLKTYHQHAGAMVDFFNENDYTIISLEGMGKPEDIFGSLLMAIAD